MKNAVIITLGSLFLVGACSETQLLVHTAKRIHKQQAPSAGRAAYKVGSPYQIAGVWYYPKVDYAYDERGIASWYGPGFHGKRTANGETYDQNALTAAHKTLPMPSLVQITNLENGRSLRLTVNDRGPFVNGRIIDVSRRGAQLLGFHRGGTAKVRVQILAAESRALAQRARGGGIVLASADTPIRSDIDVSKPIVSSEILEPPEGARPVPVQSRNFGPPGNNPPERTLNKPRLPDGTLTMQPVVPTEVYVQAGAFGEYANAHRVRARLYQVAGIKITSAIVGGREFFRVRAGPIKDLGDADQILDQMIRTGFPGARIIVD
ncbi:MAG: septal ring lytic transglycosylase RlpA family protein [Rhodospirillales bacterium]|nr:septal ring lytic transglycosylase RlpA family protein [Rhodospirillales bacterium]MDP6643930.1 septal ring lytic transglycosylase RlpA family protein [Rhodospirillales bacterium]MDP6841945.1 septal ring lytic transglycosylase RlpA family protein [Rhodospirillales bacterium]